MTDWLERLLKQAAESPDRETPAAPALAKSLNGNSPVQPGVSRVQAALGDKLEETPSATRAEVPLTAGELAAGLLREELRLGTPTLPAAAEGANWLAEPAASPIRENYISPLPTLLNSPSVFQIDRAFERDARRFDGTFSLY